MFPSASVHYLGLFREAVSLQPVEYYREHEISPLSDFEEDLTIELLFSLVEKLPRSPNVDTLYLLDPLVATGGTAMAAISMLVSLTFFAPFP